MASEKGADVSMFSKGGRQITITMEKAAHGKGITIFHFLFCLLLMSPH